MKRIFLYIGLILVIHEANVHAKESTNLYLDCIQDGDFTTTSNGLEVDKASIKENMNLPITFKAILYPDGTAKLAQGVHVMMELDGIHNNAEIDFKGSTKSVFDSGDIISNVSFNRINGEFIKTVEYIRKGNKKMRYQYGNCEASSKTKF